MTAADRLEVIAGNAARLADYLRRSECADRVILTLCDRIMHRTFTDIDHRWALWMLYCERVLFNGDRTAYEKWARENGE